METIWTLVDSDSQQYYSKVNENTFLYKETRILNPETLESYIYESEMCLDDYTNEDLEYYIAPYYTDIQEVKDTYGKDWKQIVLECIFEQEEL